MKRLGIFLLPLDGMQFVRFPQQFAGTHLYSWVEIGTVRVECLAQEHNTTEPGPLAPGTSALTEATAPHNSDR